MAPAGATWNLRLRARAHEKHVEAHVTSRYSGVMTADGDFEIFLVATPGLEGPLCAEARAKGFKAKTVPGGVTLKGGWPEVWRANLEIRGASRVIARLGSFRVVHLAQLDKRARQFAWGDVLRPDVPFRVEASCKSSKIYHSGAAAQRIERAIAEELGAPPSPEAEVCIKARIENNVCTHRRRYLGRAVAQARPQAGRRQGAHAREHGVAVSAPVRL